MSDLYQATGTEVQLVLDDNNSLQKWKRWIDLAKCVNCEKATSGSLEFCQRCYHMFKEDIKEKKPWVKVLKNDAQRERRRREREFNDVSLDAIQDAWNDRTR